MGTLSPFGVPVSSVPPAFNCPLTARQRFWSRRHLPDNRFSSRSMSDVGGWPGQQGLARSPGAPPPPPGGRGRSLTNGLTSTEPHQS